MRILDKIFVIVKVNKEGELNPTGMLHLRNGEPLIDIVKVYSSPSLRLLGSLRPKHKVNALTRLLHSHELKFIIRAKL